ncbi:hypothetical protein ACWD4O_38785 [Streptomyces sp. NPDC002623]
MAATHYSPLPVEIDDPVTYEEASALLAQTDHKAPVNTLRRWVQEADLKTVKCGRRVYVSWSDILEVHRDRTAVKLRASSNWP